MIRINEIKLKPEQTEDVLRIIIARDLKISNSDIKKLTIVKKSVDSRKKEAIKVIYTVDVTVDEETKVMAKVRSNKVSIVEESTYEYLRLRGKDNMNRPVIVGSGPAGLFAGLVLAKSGLRPIIIERGGDIDQRKLAVNTFRTTGKLNTESNVQFGLGGAGTFSDGKLTTGTKDPRIKKVLQEFTKFGAPSEILYLSKPHIGTDNLTTVVSNMKDEIISLGGEFYFNHKLTDINIENKIVTGITVQSNKGEITFKCDKLILAVGHSARDTFAMLYEKNITMTPKNFAVGVRIEHLQEMINNSQYGSDQNIEKLGQADYKLSCHLPNGRSVYTFCMCPGGEVIGAASNQFMVVTNGMSEFKRNMDNSNSALLVNVTPDDFGSDHPLAGIKFQEQLEMAAYKLGGSDYSAPVQLVSDFIQGVPSNKIGSVTPSYKPSYTLSNLADIFPDFITESLKAGILELDKKMKSFNSPDAILTGVETRSSSPVRIIRDDNQESTTVQGLYLAGEGCGYAGGIMSSAVDGIKCGENVIKGIIKEI